MTNAVIPNNLVILLNKGVEEVNQGDKVRARFYFRQALDLDPVNETALLWLAYTTNDPYEAVQLLEKVVIRNPRNEQATAYLSQARSRCSELDQLVTGSSTFNTWSRIKSDPKTAGKAVPFLGEYLLSQGLISQQQLDMALRRHQDLAQRGQPKQVGQVMVELGYISQQQLDNWLQFQNGDYSYRFKD